MIEERRRIPCVMRNVYRVLPYRYEACLKVSPK
jgi:hypothetical protein